MQQTDSNLQEDDSRRVAIKDLLKQKIYQWSIRSTSHGIPKLVTSKNVFVTSIWACFLIISIALCGFMVVQSILNYLDYDVTTKIREVPLDEIEFPSVSICHLNAFVSSEAREYWDDFFKNPLRFDISKYLINATNDEIKSLRPKNEMFINARWAHYITAHPKFNDTLRRSFSLWPGYFFDCQFGFDGCDRDADFERFYHPKYGNCFRFNYGLGGQKRKNASPIKVSKEGAGLQLSLYLGASDLYFWYLYQQNVVGMKIFLNGPDTYPLIFQDSGVLIKPGTSASIKVSRIDTTTLPKPYSNCMEADLVNTELAVLMRKIGMKYTRKNCLDMCQQKIIYQRFNCTTLELPQLFDLPVCPNPYSFVYSLKECIDDCPHECKQTTYDLSISYVDFPSRRFAEFLGNHDSLLNKSLAPIRDDNKTSEFSVVELARDSFVQISVYYDEIKYTSISEAPTISLFDMIANIGGTLGLFIGISLLSFVEIIELMIEIFLILWSHLRKK